MPVSDLDMYPTVIGAGGPTLKHQPTLDGAKILPLIEEKVDQRPTPIGFTRGGHSLKAGNDMTAFKFITRVY